MKKGSRMSPESRERCRQAQLIVQKDPDLRERMRLANTGKKRTLETKKRMSENNCARRPEEKERRRLLLLGKKIGLGNKGRTSETFTPEHRKVYAKRTRAYFSSLTDEQWEEWHEKNSRGHKWSGTSIEKILESILLEREISFEKQYGIGRYVVDFADLENKVAYEADGEYWHSSPKAVARDKKRDEYLEERGWTTIRFSESELPSQ
jgi:very-short-patch-repair endonuclease